MKSCSTMQGSHLGFQASGLGSKVISGLGPGLAPRMGSAQGYPNFRGSGLGSKQESGLTVGSGRSGHRFGLGSGRGLGSGHGLGSGRGMMSNLGGGMQVRRTPPPPPHCFAEPLGTPKMPSIVSVKKVL